MKKIFLALLLIASIIPTVEARQPKRGYRGFLDWSNSLRRPQSWFGEGRYNEFYTGFSTSHGFQFNPHFYLGGGLGWEHNKKYDIGILPLFVHVRTDQQYGKFTPFADLKLGLNACTDYSGLYISPSVGYRFNWGRKMGVNVSLGYTMIPYKADTYDIYPVDLDYENDQLGYIQIGDDFISGGIMWEYKGRKWYQNSYFSFRVGIDF